LRWVGGGTCSCVRSLSTITTTTTTTSTTFGYFVVDAVAAAGIVGTHAVTTMTKRCRTETDNAYSEKDDDNRNIKVAIGAGPQQQHPPPYTAPTKKLFSIFTCSNKKSKTIQSTASSQVQQQQLRTSSTTTSTPSQDETLHPTHIRRIFCDLDGVLVDFDFGVRQLETIHEQSKHPHKVKQFKMWSHIPRAKHFYRTLPWTSDGRTLWNTLVQNSIALRQPNCDTSTSTTTNTSSSSSSSLQYEIHILTGVPWNCPTAALDKYHWCQRELQWSNPPIESPTTTSAAANAAAATLNKAKTDTLTETTELFKNTSSGTDASDALSIDVEGNDDTSRHSATKTQQALLPQHTKWYWRNMAGTKRTHKRINLCVSDPTMPRTANAAIPNNGKIDTRNDTPDVKTDPNTAAKEDTASTRTLLETTGSVSKANRESSREDDDPYRPTVITCWSYNKNLECRRRRDRDNADILIDDRPNSHKLQEKWENTGGIFIHHTSAENTIQQLIQLGVITSPNS
jgi:hypothetical protein